MSHLTLTPAQQARANALAKDPFRRHVGMFPVNESLAVYITYWKGKQFETYCDKNGIIKGYSACRLVPIPTKTTVVFNGSLTIRKIFFPIIPGGLFTERTGGVGQKSWSIVFASQDPQLRPYVEVSVWKKDHCAAQLLELNARKINSLNIITQLQVQKGETTRSIQEIDQTIRFKENEKSLAASQVAQIDEELRPIQQQLQERKAQLEVKKQIFIERGPQIRSLINFLKIMHEIGFSIENSEIQVLHNNIAQVEEVIGEDEDPQSPFSKILKEKIRLFETANRALGKEVIGVIGPTGTGKSTFVNHLLGCRMQRKKNGFVKVANPDNDITTIGHGLTVSETLISEVYSAPSVSPFNFADCGGFFETRGLPEKILGAASTKLTLSSANSLKLVFCASVKSIHRSGIFMESLEALKNFLGGLNLNDRSTLMLFTRSYFDEGTKRNITKEDILLTLTGYLEGILGESERELLQFILREDGKYIQVYDPLSEISRQDVSQILNEMDPIENPKEHIHNPFTNPSITQLLETALPIASLANSTYRTLRELENECSQLQEHERRLISQKLLYETNLVDTNRLIQEKLSEKSALSQNLTNLSSEEQRVTNERSTADAEIHALDTEDLITYISRGTGWTV